MSNTTISPTTLFNALAGTWTLDRDLESTNTNEPSGKCTGTASLTPRDPSPVVDSEGKLQLADAEMLYHERGEFRLPSNISMPFTKKYAWRLTNTPEPKISVWFLKPGTEKVDYLFHKIDLHAGDADTVPQGTGGHLCIDDFYSTSYKFKTDEDGHEVVSWETVHEVRGPKKDQVLTTTFTR
jgi:hypothetical protein